MRYLLSRVAFLSLFILFISTYLHFTNYPHMRNIINYYATIWAYRNLHIDIFRISGNAASNKNIHGTVSEQLKKNFAKSRWKVGIVGWLACR